MRIHVFYDETFLKSAKKLPRSTQRKLAILIETLQEDPFHSYLHTKRLSGSLRHLFSFRVTREWRCLFLFEGKENIRLLDVGHRKDIYR